MEIIRAVVGQVETNCYMVTDEKTNSCIIIDPGDEAEAIIEMLAKEKIRPLAVLLTHAHFDHILAIPQLLAEFEALDVWVNPKELENEKYHKEFFENQEWILAEVCKPFLYRNGEEISIGSFKCGIISTPGHTPGSISIKLGNNLFCGDLLFKEDCGSTEFPGGSVSELQDSLKRIGRMTGNYKIYPGHGEATDLEHEKAHNIYLKAALESKLAEQM